MPYWFIRLAYKPLLVMSIAETIAKSERPGKEPGLNTGIRNKCEAAIIATTHATAILVITSVPDLRNLLLAYDTAVVEPVDQPGEVGDALALQLPAGLPAKSPRASGFAPHAAGATRFGVLGPGSDRRAAAAATCAGQRADRALNHDPRNGS